MKQAIAYTFDGVTSCQWLSDDEARIIQQNQQGIPAGEAREYFLGGELLFRTWQEPNAALSVTPIPVGAAREIAFGGPIAFEDVPLGGPLDGMKPGGRLLRVRDLEFSQQGPSVEEVALMFGVKVEPDPNAAMIERDAQNTKSHCVVDDALMLDCRPFTFWSSDGGVSFSLQKPGVKPAITGLTTVHDGKVNGLSFCSDLGHE